MLRYEVDKERLTIEEKTNGDDKEFWLKLLRPDADMEKAIKEIRAFYDENETITDVLFYAHHNGEYQWIVRSDYYVDFVIHLFKYRLITRVEWIQ